MIDGEENSDILRKKEHEVRMEKFKIKRIEYESKKKAFVARNFKSEFEIYFKSNLSSEAKNEKAQLESEKRIITERLAAFKAKEKSKQTKTEESELKILIIDFKKRANSLKNKYKFEKEQYLKKFQEQIQTERNQLIAEGQALEAEEKLLSLERARFEPNSDEIIPQNITTSSCTFINQAATPLASVINQTGISLNDLTDYLRNDVNVAKLNHDAERKLVHVDRSLQEATAREIKLELGKEGEVKTTVLIRKGNNASGNDTLSYQVNKEAKDDLESIKSVCRLAVFSAAEKDKPIEFKVNENHPHSDKIRDYLSAAIQDLAPEKVTNFKVNDIVFNQKTPIPSSTKSLR